MGFYYRSRPASQDDGQVITPREYTALVADAVSWVTSDPYRGAAEATTTSSLLERLSRRARRHPLDPTTHRRLGIAHLYAGNCKPAVRHLEIAVNILLAQATTRGCLRQTLCARLELALLLPVLLPLCLQLGKRETALRLVSDVLLAR